MEAMSKMCSPYGPEIQEKRVTSIFSQDDFSIQDVRKDDKLKSAEAEMGEVKEENERLKMVVEQVEKDYQSLQLHFFDILHKEASKKGVTDETEEPELVSLSLGRTPREPKKDARIENPNISLKKNEDLEACLTLGLDSKFMLSMSNNLEDPKDAESEGTLSTHKMRNENDEISDQMPAKRARVSVRARCDGPVMNDGCQWRKYGQKIAKANPCPRAYYRCTVAPACPVRKQVQRCAEDMSILITTYEGTHNHPLPFSSSAIASTTCAAASMLLSGPSTTSQPKSHIPSSLGNVPTLLLNGHSFSHQFDQPRAEHVLLPNHASHLFPNDGTMPIDKTHIRPVILGNQFQQHFYQQCNKNQTPSKEALEETITKVINTDPSFRSVIAAAVSSIVGQGSSTGGYQEGREILASGLNLKQRELPQLNQYNKRYLEGYFKRLLPSSSSQVGECMILQPQLPYSSLQELIDHINH